MKQALKALENAVRYYGIMLMSDPPQDAWKYYRVEDNAKQAITALREALAQPAPPVQEPVTCRFCHDARGSWTWQCYHCGEIDDVQKPAAQRPWQGLTEFQFAEIYNKWNDTNGSTPWGLNQALEAKLKELNK